MSKRTRQELNADITPLIDVVFLLLIFFMTSTVFKKSEVALLLNLPKTENSEGVGEGKNKNVIIELSKEEIAINGKKKKVEEMDAFLGSLKKKDTPIDLRVDKDVVYSRLIRVLDTLKKYNLANLSLITEK